MQLYILIVDGKLFLKKKKNLMENVKRLEWGKLRMDLGRSRKFRTNLCYKSKQLICLSEYIP